MNRPEGSHRLMKGFEINMIISDIKGQGAQQTRDLGLGTARPGQS